MALLIHITDVKNERSIRRSGLRAGRAGLYALPATDDYMANHQWARELKRFGAKTPIAVFFRVSGDTRVSCGKYHERHANLSLNEAIQRYARQADPRGFEIILSTPVPRKNIVSIRHLRRPVGWRFFPTAKGTTPRPWRGEYDAARIRRRLDLLDD